MKKYPMTTQGAQALRDELSRLKTEERPKIIEAIALARAFGDLKENAEYHAAKEHQGFVEGRIQEIEAKLSHAEVIDLSKLPKTGKVMFGSIVVLAHVDNDEDEKRYQLVGDDEADLKAGKISVNSPIARALIGKEAGDVVMVRAPAGDSHYEIVRLCDNEPDKDAS